MDWGLGKKQAGDSTDTLNAKGHKLFLTFFRAEFFLKNHEASKKRYANFIQMNLRVFLLLYKWMWDMYRGQSQGRKKEVQQRSSQWVWRELISMYLVTVGKPEQKSEMNIRVCLLPPPEQNL